MDYFEYRHGRAYCEQMGLEELAAQFATPLYVYSSETLSRHCRRLVDVFAAYPTLACFAVKANSNLSYLKQVFAHGLGADIVSGGELRRCLLAGVDPKKVVFSGVGKLEAEIVAGLDAGILSFNVESPFEVATISRIARARGQVADIALRLNPNIDANTHPKISTGMHSTKFGITEFEAKELAAKISGDKHLRLVGLGCHIGSQITDLSPLHDAAQRMSEFAAYLKGRGHKLQFLNMGGGLGIRYRDENPPSLEDYAKTLLDHVRPTGLQLVIEPGRVVCGNSGVLLTKVIGIKRTPQKTFVIVDASMTELIRPALYGSYHEILPVNKSDPNEATTFDVVGPVCESSDVLGEERRFGLPQAGDLLYIRGCGGYSACMSTNYNSRPRPAEVMVSGKNVAVVRRRESLEEIWALEL